ncbi:hypothetical protein DFH06DRAFT_758513 [Mycena polygramma]|nr:hypothetical protein DFH06DRAFT_758513 [Mycena polygramma]
MRLFAKALSLALVCAVVPNFFFCCAGCDIAGLCPSPRLPQLLMPRGRILPNFYSTWASRASDECDTPTIQKPSSRHLDISGKIETECRSHNLRSRMGSCSVRAILFFYLRNSPRGYSAMSMSTFLHGRRLIKGSGYSPIQCGRTSHFLWTITIRRVSSLELASPPLRSPKSNVTAIWRVCVASRQHQRPLEERTHPLG